MSTSRLDRSSSSSGSDPPPLLTPQPRRVALGYAFVERQTNLWKRHWGWEIVWLLYGVVNTLAITFIAAEAERGGLVSAEQARELVLFLLIGTLVWAYLSAVLDDQALVIMWERWEGTIEHTLMAPVPRAIHLFGNSAFGLVHAVIRTLLILAMSLPFFDVDFGQADWLAAIAVLVVGSISVAGLGILTSTLPLLYPERGEQMSFMCQAVVLLISGVYYSVDVLPAWLKATSYFSPATYLLRGIRSALIAGAGISEVGRDLAILAVFGVILVPVSIWAFSAAEHHARRTGKLKRQG